MRGRSVLGLLLASVLLVPVGVEAGVFWSNAMSGDGDSGIEAAKTYTHAANIRGADATVNGVLFTSGDTSGTGWTLGGTSNTYDNSGPGALTGNVGQLVDDFRYGPGNGQASLTLTGLTPGQSYVTTWYNKAWGGAGGRIVGVSATDGGGMVFDENFTGDGNGNQLHYGYVAPASGSITYNFANYSGDTFHHYAFSNEEAPAGSYQSAFSTAPLTGDADSGIAANKLYTHTVDSAGTNPSGWRSVNGVQFQRGPVPVAGDTSGSNWSMTGMNSGLEGGPNPNYVTGDIGTLVNDFWYNGNPETLTLTGLVPGNQYQLVWYARGWGGPGGRIQTITTDDGVGGPAIDTFGFDENFTGDGNGNKLIYNYTAPASGQLHITFTPQGAGTFHQYAFTNELLPGPNVLLADSFNASVNYYPISNGNPVVGDHQIGTLGPVGWTVGGNAQIGNGAVTESDPPARHPGVFLAANGGWAGLIHNFNNAESDGGLSISFDLDPKWVGYAGTDLSEWGAISLGSGRFANGWVNRGEEHFGILFRGNGDIQAFDGSADVTGGAPGLGALNGTLTHFEIRLTDPGDGNPFDGVGQTNIDVYADSNPTPVYSYIKTGGGYANNFINLQGYNYAQFDNLVIESLDGPYTPPPSPFSTALLTGDADSGIEAGGAYTHAINFNHTGNTIVNGAVFTGSGANVDNPATNNYSAANLANNFSGNTNPVTGATNGLLTEFLYDGDTPETLTLNNLRPGQRYVTTFYNTAFGGIGGRPINITTSQGDQLGFDENFSTDGSSDRNGNVLRYEYVAQDTSLTFTFSPLNVNASMHQYAFTNEMVGYKALLTDNFYGPNNPDTQNINWNLADRQGGLLVEQNGPISWTKINNIQVGNATGNLDGGNYLLGADGRGSPDWNFNDATSRGGLLISFDAATQINDPSGTGWAGLVLGASEADRLIFMNQAQEHFGILFRGDGRLEAWDGATRVSPTGPDLTWGPAGEGNQFHHFELLLSDRGDLNPFDGVGETQIDVFADGLPVFSFTKDGGGYANNYLNFHYSGVAGFDNLMIARMVPEPSTFVLAALGLLGLAFLGRRRRRSR